MVQAPSGLVMGLPATATPANRGTPALKSPLKCLTSSDGCFVILCICFLLPDLPAPAELQGVSWDAPGEVSRSMTEAQTEEEPLYAVPRKDHQPKYTVDDFILHKMLGKGSFGKVQHRS